MLNTRAEVNKVSEAIISPRLLTAFSRLEKIKLSDIWFYSTILLFWFFLNITYVLVIAPQYGYMGFVLEESALKVTASFVLLCLFVFFLPRSFNSPSSLLTLALFVMTYPPALTMFGYGGASVGFLLMNTLFWAVMLPVRRFAPLLRLPCPAKGKSWLFTFIILAACGYCIYSVVSTFGFSISISLSGVYDQRAAYKAASIPLSSYLFTWCANVILPMGFIWFLTKKKYLLSLLPILSQLLLFSATGMKSMLFAIPIVAAFILFMQLKDPSCKLLTMLLIVTALCLFCFTLFGEIMPLSLVTRRVFLVPAQISNYYYEFFSQEGSITLSHSIFSNFSEYRFEAEPAKFISRVFVGSESNFNCNLIADGFTNFGYIGVACYGIFLGFFFRLIDSAARGKDMRIVYAGVVMFLSSLSNSALVTNLGTHGMAIAVLMLWLLPLKNDIKPKPSDVSAKKT